MKKRAIEIVVPPGMGDISWVYGKLRHLKAQLPDRQVVFSAHDGHPRRAHHFVNLLPDVKFGRYVDGDWHSASYQILPPRWNPMAGLAPLIDAGGPVVVSANVHLEAGQPLSEWLPALPLDYHYKIKIPPDAKKRAKKLTMGEVPVIGAYVSSALSADNPAWLMWSKEMWIAFLSDVREIVGPCRFLMIGAEYDRKNTEEIGYGLMGTDADVNFVVGEELPVALDVVRRLDYLFAYPSGIGILANVLRTPALMLLPRFLWGMEHTFADPADLSSGAFRAWPTPTVERALLWFQETGLPHLKARRES